MENQTPNIQTPATEVSVQVPPPKKFSFPMIPLLLVILVLLLAFTGYLFYQNMQLKNILISYQTQPTLTPTPSPEPETQTPIPETPSPSPDPTANWKTYTNTTYSFKYPANWTLNDLTNGQQVETYYQPDRTKSVGEILVEKLNNAPDNLSQYKTKKDIGNVTMDCMTDTTLFKTWCYSPESKISILITLDQDATYNITLDQILSTFKFTN